MAIILSLSSKILVIHDIKGVFLGTLRISLSKLFAEWTDNSIEIFLKFNFIIFFKKVWKLFSRKSSLFKSSALIKLNLD